MIELRKINKDNYSDCLKLSVKESQKSFVATNMFSLAQAYASYETFHPLAAYEGETMVGFAMYVLDKSDLWIYRFMIDQAHQGKGLGKKAFAALLERMQAEYPGHQEIFISFEPENVIAEKLYACFGFEKTGEMAGDECIAVCKLSPR